jgi:hypothetical protein
MSSDIAYEALEAISRMLGYPIDAAVFKGAVKAIMLVVDEWHGKKIDATEARRRIKELEQSIAANDAAADAALAAKFPEDKDEP